MTVMAGVSLVGFSGSMVKDAVKDASVALFSSVAQAGINQTAPTAPVPPPEPIDSPEVTKVLLGTDMTAFLHRCC